MWATQYLLKGSLVHFTFKKNQFGNLSKIVRWTGWLTVVFSITKNRHTYSKEFEKFCICDLLRVPHRAPRVARSISQIVLSYNCLKDY